MQLRWSNVPAKRSRKSLCGNQCFNSTLQSSTSRRLPSVLLKSSLKWKSCLNCLRAVGSRNMLELRELGLQHFLCLSDFFGNGSMNCAGQKGSSAHFSDQIIRRQLLQSRVGTTEGLGSSNAEYFSIMVLAALPRAVSVYLGRGSQGFGHVQKHSL